MNNNSNQITKHLQNNSKPNSNVITINKQYHNSEHPSRDIISHGSNELSDKQSFSNATEKSQVSKARKQASEEQIECEWCEKHKTLPKNMKSHLKTCDYYTRLKIKFREIKTLVDGQTEPKSMFQILLEEKAKEYQSNLQKLQEKCASLESENTLLKQENKELYDEVKRQQPEKNYYNKDNVLCMIENTIISVNTRDSYNRVWKGYINWLESRCGPEQKSQQYPLLAVNADSYIQHLIRKDKNIMYSSTYKIRAILQTVLRRITRLDVHLFKPAGKANLKKYKRKRNFLTQQQVENLLDYLKKSKPQYYLPVLIQYRTSTRINAVANLKLEHLFFNKIKDSRNIYLPDSKTIPVECGKFINTETRNEINDFVSKHHQEITDREEYLFYCGPLKKKTFENDELECNFIEKQHTQRSQNLAQKINAQLKVWLKINNLSMKLTTHDIRRSSIQNVRFKKLDDEADRLAYLYANHKNRNVTNIHYKDQTAHTFEETFERKLEKMKNSKTSNSPSNRVIFSDSENESQEEVEENVSDSNFSVKNIKNPYSNCLNKKRSRSQQIKSKIDEQQIPHRRLYRKISNLYLPKSDKKDDKIFITTFERALNDKNIKYEENLVFETYDKNNPSNSEQIQKLPKPAVKIYKEFKDRIEGKKYAPLKLVKDDIQGWKVESTKPIKKHTLISEYGGVVRENTSEIKKSNSVMNYFNTKNCELVIFPDKIGNLGRFLSGVNNKKIKKSKRKNVESSERINHPNCHAQMFNIDGSLHVLIYTIRDIKEGETLFYDYNGGMLNEVDTNSFE